MATPTLTSRPPGQDLEPPHHAAGRGHIGRIVAASLIVGIVAALVLVLGPFAGAEEDVISGSVLLAFAFGWALLTVLSTRWTDQPQRWAAVPAAFMAAFGIGLLAMRPSNTMLEALGWVWPLAVLALVVWMIVHARRSLRSRTRAWLLYPVFAVLILAAIGGSYETVQESLDRNAYAMTGQLIDVGGHRLHLECTGSGRPTVVLEPGLGEPAVMMSGWIAPGVARYTRVCVYDRAGRGWSEASAHPQDGVAVATDLHTLLQRAHVNGPYVLAGHSTGGVYPRIFAARYPAQVAGMVLLDSQSNDAFKLAGFPTFYSVFRRASALLPSLSRLGVERLIYLSSASDMPEPAWTEERNFWSTARHWRSLRNEFAELPTALKQARMLHSLGNKPLIVVTARKDAQAGWLPQQNAMARLSTNSLHRVLVHAKHTDLTEDRVGSAESIRAIVDVVRAVRTARPLAP